MHNNKIEAEEDVVNWIIPGTTKMSSRRSRNYGNGLVDMIICMTVSPEGAIYCGTEGRKIAKYDTRSESRL